jgi:hypothetical protein
MKRNFFIAAAASAVSMSAPLLARAEDLTKRVPTEANVGAPGWRERYCRSAIVWLNVASGRYYYKGDRWYGRTKRGAYTCEREAMKAGNCASLDGQQ